jgi:hypothetical protein
MIKHESEEHELVRERGALVDQTAAVLEGLHHETALNVAINLVAMVIAQRNVRLEDAKQDVRRAAALVDALVEVNWSSAQASQVQH